MPLGDLLLDSELDDGAIFKLIFCEGCQQYHGFQLNENLDPHWDWNGDERKPTFTPALKIKNESGQVVCHFKITDGIIQYFNDSKHIFAGLIITMSEA